MSINNDQASLELHRQLQGKLLVKSKSAITSREDLALVYTPGVAAVSRLIAADKEQAKQYTIKGNTIAVISDGSAVLGLGNIGPEGAMPVMEGKCALFSEFAGVNAFPLCLATQDTEEIIKTVKYLAPSFGGINLEDISAPRCFEIEARLKEELDIPVMHDDQHGTATVVLAGLINALRLKDLSPELAKVVISGAGAAGLAIAELLYKYGFRQLIISDSQGAIYEGRAGLNPAKERLAKLSNLEKLAGPLETIIQGAQVFIGVSVPKALSPAMIKTMAPRPIIFALANPEPEIMPELAQQAGALIVATGRSDYPNQVNNVLAFPGIFRGALDNQVKQITDAMLIKAAENIASLVTEPRVDQILPPALDKQVAVVVAQAIKD